MLFKKKVNVLMFVRLFGIVDHVKMTYMAYLLFWTELCDFWRESIKIYKSVMASSIVNYIRYVITMGFSVHP